MHLASIAILTTVCCCFVSYVTAEDSLPAEENLSSILDGGADTSEHPRQKRTLLLKKKLIGAGLLGFGLGVAKGYKASHYSAPEVRHVYLSPPPPPPPPPSVKYVEYVEKPIFVERIVERPASVFKPIHNDPSAYGSW